MPRAGLTTALFLALFAPVAATTAPGESPRPEVGHSEEIYGRELPIVKDVGLGPAMAARVVGQKLYSIGRGKLHVLDIADPAGPKRLATLDGLGATRQIEVEHKIAYITSREDGVFIVDVADSRRPKLLCHYDPIEVATGMDVSGDVMLVACRSHGVELIDVRDPEEPSFVAHRQLGHADVEIPKYMGTKPLPGFVGGLALAEGHVYTAGGWSDLHVVAAPGLAKPCRREPDRPPVIGPPRHEPNPRFRVWRPGGQVRAVAVAGDMAVVAAGSDGVCVVRLSPEFVELGRYPTEGFAMEVKLLGDHAYVAEEKGGLSIWRRTACGASRFWSAIGSTRPTAAWATSASSTFRTSTTPGSWSTSTCPAIRADSCSTGGHL